MSFTLEVAGLISMFGLGIALIVSYAWLERRDRLRCEAIWDKFERDMDAIRESEKPFDSSPENRID